MENQNNPPPTYGGERSLNCLFQFDGHTWDAFEILGIPAGSDKKSCLDALNQMRLNQEAPEDFLNAVLAAVTSQLS